MKKILILLLLFVSCITLDASPQILSQEIIPTECVQGVYQNTRNGKFYMTYYNAQKELKVASIAKTELEKYWLCKNTGATYTVVLQHLKTKDRIIIRC